jgi:hypothetical protein|eukprot:COSAG03_NODE_366_length_8532_cov_32.998696_11_plen_72_part_00
MSPSSRIYLVQVETHDDLATLEMAVAWDDLQLPEWVDEYNRQLFGRPPRPPSTAAAGKKKKKNAAKATDGL